MVLCLAVTVSYAYGRGGHGGGGHGGGGHSGFSGGHSFRWISVYIVEVSVAVVALVVELAAVLQEDIVEEE